MARHPSGIREQILDAAVRVLRESGVKHLAQTQVARAAGVPQGHLTYYFPRKLDLIAAVAQRFVEMLAEDFRVFVAEAGPTFHDDRWRAGALAFAGRLAKDRERTRMLLGLIVESENDPALREVIARHAQMVRALLAGALELPEDDPDVDLLLATLWGIGLQHFVFRTTRPDSRTDEILDRLKATRGLIQRRPEHPVAAPPTRTAPPAEKPQ